MPSSMRQSTPCRSSSRLRQPQPQSQPRAENKDKEGAVEVEIEAKTGAATKGQVEVKGEDAHVPPQGGSDAAAQTPAG